MKKFKLVGCGIFILVLMFGCGARDVTQFDVDIAKNNHKTMLSCMQHRKPDLTGIATEHTAFVLMSWENGERMMALMGKHPCIQGTNVYDSQIAEVEAKNKALSSGFGSLSDIGMWYIGGEVIKSAISSMNHYEVSGQDNGLNVTNEDGSRNTATDDSHNTATDDSYNTTETVTNAPE